MRHENTRCKGCIFLSEYQDMGASTPVCVREGGDFLAAIRACDTPGPCHWHITLTQVKQMQSPPVMAVEPARDPGLSPMDAERVLEKIQNSETASEAFQTAIAQMAEAAKPLGQAIAALIKGLKIALDEAKREEAEISGGINRCPCGGLLVMRGKKQKDKHCLVHILIKCQKCGAWFGGYTSRPKRN